MELGRAAIYGLFVMMCMNAVSIMLGQIGITGVPVSAWNQTNVEQSLNASEIVDTWTWQNPSCYDIAKGLTFFWYRTVPIIESFPNLLQSYGCPSFIYNPIHNIWRRSWTTIVALVIIAGRRV